MLEISNKETSTHVGDGLKLYKTYITNILKCVPPGDKPLNQELINCAKFFDKEISNLRVFKSYRNVGKSCI